VSGHSVVLTEPHEHFRLSAAAPVDVCGVARIRNLLTDGTGPLYREVAPGGLNRELLAALRAMDSLI